ncbi:MAG: hypothetical protein AB1626_03570, partial [Candidatus Micrarchaeota archaeon]
MPEEELPIQRFYRLVKEFQARQINRRQLHEGLPAALSGMQGVELDAALHGLFEDKRYGDVHPDVAEIMAKHADPQLAHTIAGLFEQTAHPVVSNAFAKVLVKCGEPVAGTLLKTLQAKGEESEEAFDRRLSTVKALRDAQFNAYGEESQAALLKELARMCFDKEENDLVRAQSLESLREITEGGNMRLLAAAEVLAELVKRMPKTQEDRPQAFGRDETLQKYFAHTLSKVVDDATKAAVTARKAEAAPPAKTEKGEAALRRFAKQLGQKTAAPETTTGVGRPLTKETREATEEKIEDSLHALFKQSAFPELRYLGITGLGDLGRPTVRTMKMLFEQAEHPSNKFLAADALIKLAPAIGESPKLLGFISKKFVQNTTVEPFLAAYYGKLLSRAGPHGQQQLLRIMSAHESEEVARHAAQWLAHTEEGVNKLSAIVSLPGQPARVMARAAFGLGAVPPILANKRKGSHLLLLDSVASSTTTPLEVRQAAVQGLLGAGEKGVAKVRRMIERATTPEGKFKVAKWLTQVPAGLDALAEILSTHPDVTTRSAAALAVESSPTTLASILPKTKKGKTTEHPLYTALKKKAADADEAAEVRATAGLALKRLRAV